MLVSSKRCCFASEPEIPCEHLSSMSDGILGLLAPTACGGG